MNAIVASVIVFLVQLGTGWVKAVAARNAAQSANDLLDEVTVGKGTVKFDKSDILAIAFVIFVFCAVGSDCLAVLDVVTAFVIVLAGTGLDDAVAAWYHISA